MLAPDALRDTFEVNLFAAADFARWLCASDAGSPPVGDATGDSQRATPLVLVSSMGRWHGMHSSAGYNASKAALSIWGESLGMELARTGNTRVTVSIVEPGLFESGMTRSTGLARLLSVPRRKVAGRIVEGALAGRRTMRPPLWFALLTWALCLAGRTVRIRLLGRAKAGSREGA